MHLPKPRWYITYYFTYVYYILYDWQHSWYAYVSTNTKT